MFFTLALRNIRKHLHRSVVVFGGVALAVLMMSIIAGILHGITVTFLGSILPTAGHIVVSDARSKDANNPVDLKYLVPDADALLATIHDDRIVSGESVLTFGALLVQPVEPGSKTEAKNLGMLGQGVDPGTKFLANIRAGVTQGAFLPDGKGILVSEKAAKLLGVKMGGTLVVMTTDRGNNPWYQELPITGLFDSGSETADLTNFVVSKATARDLVDAPGMSRELKFLLKDPEQAPAVAASLDAALKDKGLRAEPWEVTFSGFLVILRFLDILTYLIRGFFVIVAGSVITNSILMTVFERTREYGTLRAIGLKKRQLEAMILTEGMVLGGLGAALGLLVATPVVLALSKFGLDLGSATEAIGFGSKIYAALLPSDMVFNYLFGALVAVFASLYAARVSGKLTVTEALTHTS
jgi:putative ABC transport system permease protein